MSDVFGRLWATLQTIPRAPRRIDARTIRERLETQGFETDIRTVQRDLQTLSESFPLQCDSRNKPFGWYWEKSVKVENLPGMDPQTALTFVLVEQFMIPVLPRTTLKYLTPHFKLAYNVLKEASAVPMSQWPNKVRVVPNGQTLMPAAISPSVLDVVYDALLQGHRFEVDYQVRSSAELKQYEVNPLGLVLRNSVTYLVSTLWAYDDIKLLALHRMRAAKPLATKVTVPEDFRLQDYIDSGELGFPGDAGPIRPIRLRVLFDPEAAYHLYEMKLSEDQRLSEQADGRILLEATVLQTGELQWWLRGFGELVEVVAPRKLRRVFAASAQQQLAQYQ